MSFGEEGISHQKNEGVFHKWLNRLRDALKTLAVEALPTIVGKIVGAILSFLGEVIGFVAEHTTWALIVFVTGLIVVRLMQKVKKG